MVTSVTKSRIQGDIKFMMSKVYFIENNFKSNFDKTFSMVKI